MMKSKTIQTNGVPTLHKQYLDETFDDEGRLTHLGYHIPQRFNFAYDVIDELARRSPDKRAMLHLSDSLEVRGGGNEVSLAAETYDNTLCALDADENRTLGGLAVGALGGDELTLLTDDVDCLLEVTLSLGESLLAIHHTSGCHLA